MPKFPVAKPKDVINALKKIGFEVIRISGSHYVLKKDNNIVPIPYHNRDLKIKTLKSIIQQAGITVDELRKIL